MDLAKFVWLLEHRQLFFPSLEMLADPHEGASTKRYAERMSDFFDSHPEFEQGRESMQQYSLEARKTMHVSCWNLGNAESEAMWRLYCPDNQGVAIQTTYQKLIDSVDEYPEIHIGAVLYLDYETEAISQGTLFDSVMQKRQSFSHEQEVRLVKWISQDEAGANPFGISIDWPVNESVERIYIDPYAPAYFEDVVRSVVKKFATSMEDRIYWSKMRSAPIFGLGLK